MTRKRTVLDTKSNYSSNIESGSNERRANQNGVNGMKTLKSVVSNGTQRNPHHAGSNVNTSSRKRIGKRSSAGQGLIEGVCSLVLITMGVVLFVAFLLNVGFSSYYKERLGFVVDQAARYAGSLSGEDAGKKEDVEKFCIAMMKQMAIDGQNVTIKLAKADLNGEEGTTVEISTDLPLVQQLGGVFPAKINLTEHSVSIGDGLAITGYLKFKSSTPDGTKTGLIGGQESKVDMGSQLGFKMGTGGGTILVPIIKAKGLKGDPKNGEVTGDKPILNAIYSDGNGMNMMPVRASTVAPLGAPLPGELPN